MATSKISYDKMGGYKLIEWTGTTPSTAGTEYRVNVTGANNNGYAYCVGFQVQNANNSGWYQINNVAWMNGQALRFILSDTYFAGQPFHALILSK